MAKRTKLGMAARERRWKPVMLRRGVYNKIVSLMRRDETRGDVVLKAVRALEKIRGKNRCTV